MTSPYRYDPECDAASLARAAATLTRATRFFGAGGWTVASGAGAISAPLRAKVIGNGLRELDRFLNLLIDEIAAAAAIPGLDLARLARQRNTPNKLRTLRAALALPSPDDRRLRAIGRSRDCLFHCAGIVRRGDARGSASLTAGWPPARTLVRGEALPVTAANLAEVCGFYDRVAHELVAAGAIAR